MFNMSPDSVYPVVIIMAVILIFEWVGGLSSVALTDCIQAVVMVVSISSAKNESLSSVLYLTLHTVHFRYSSVCDQQYVQLEGT